MDVIDRDIISFENVKSLFGIIDEYYDKHFIDLFEYKKSTARYLSEYIEAAKKSFEEMGDEYDYHNYDYGVEQELVYEALAAEGVYEYFNELKELHLMSLLEMKVLYLYKEVEIRLKTIISNKYNKSIKSLKNLNSIIDYFLDRGINIKEIKDYDKVNELRLVSNDLKHSIKIYSAKDVIEFSDLIEFDSLSLNKFLSLKIYEVENFFEGVIKKFYLNNS